MSSAMILPRLGSNAIHTAKFMKKLVIVSCPVKEYLQRLFVARQFLQEIICILVDKVNIIWIENYTLV